MGKRRAAYVSLATVGFLLAAGNVVSEMPDWADVRAQVLMTRHHWWYEEREEEDLQTSGIWSFDGSANALRLLRPLSLSMQWDGMIPKHYTGYGDVLATIGDRLVVEMWPHHLEYEAGSWRLLRRYPPAAGFSPMGWAVQGPIVSGPAASSLGLEPGIYGFATCILRLTTTGFETYPRSCEQYQFPGWDQALRRGGDYSVLLHRSLDPLVADATFVGDVTPYEYDDSNVPALSFDGGRGGFWRAGPTSIEFLPVVDGVLQPASIVHELDVPWLSDGWELFALHRHPASGHFFAVARVGDSGESSFIELAGDFSLIGTHDLPHTSWVGWPISITSFDELPNEYLQTLPIASHTRGRHGTVWSTDLWFYNPSDEPMTVDARRVIEPGVHRTVELPARGSVKITDALSWIGGGPQGDGVKNDALVLASPYRWGRNLVAASRTFTTDEGGGSYGQAVPAVPGTVGYSNHLPYDEDGSIMYNAHLPSTQAATIVLDRRDPSRFRHNLGIVNDGGDPVLITLHWSWSEYVMSTWGPRQPVGVVERIEVAPHSVSIVNLEQLFPEEVRDHWPPRIGVFGDRPVLLWLSMVDNLTGDATFVPFTNYFHSEEGFDARAVLPVAAHNAGKGETFWVTDLYGCKGESWHLSGDGYSDRPGAFFHPQQPGSQCGGAAAQGEIMRFLKGDIGMPLPVWLDTLADIGLVWSESTAKNGRQMIYPDVTRLFAECEGEEEIKGGVEVLTQSWTSGYSRTYTSRDDGGTYGGMLPLYPPNGWPVQHFAGIEVGGEFRINLGFFNGDHEHAITHRVTLYRADGTEVASTEFDLAPLRLKQQSLERILGLAKGALEPGTYGMTVLPLDDDETGVQGRSWAFVSLVENTTGDPTNWW